MHEGERIGGQAKKGRRHDINYEAAIAATTGFVGGGAAAEQVAAVPLPKKP